MNREIKFRGIDVISGRFVRGHYVNFLKVDEDGSPEVHAIINRRGAWTYILPETVGQYAGFKDKNGTDVYEGDIVEAWSQGCKGMFRIAWRQGGAPIWLLYPNGQHRQMWNISCTEHKPGKQFIDVSGNVESTKRIGFYDDGLMIIGNIYQNPELIAPSDMY